MHFIGRSPKYTVVVSAPSAEDATRTILALFQAAGLPVEEMDVMMFDPSLSGGILMENTGDKSWNL